MTVTNKTVGDRVRDVGEGLIIGFPTDQTRDGGSRTKLDAYFFKVAECQRLYYHYDQLGSFTAGDSEDYDYLGETGLGSGDDILRVNSDDFHVYHFGIGMNTTDLRVYEKVDPASGGNTAFDYRGATDNPDPTAPTDFGYYDGSMIGNRYDPSAITERLSFRNDKDGGFIQYGFYADDDVTAAGAELEITGRGYKLIPVTSTEEQNTMLASHQRSDDEAEIPTTFVIEGGLEAYSLGTQQPDNWTDDFSQTLTSGVLGTL